MTATKKNNWSLGMGIFILLGVLVWIFTQIQAQNNPPGAQVPLLIKETESEPAQTAETETKTKPASELYFYAVINDTVTYLYSYNPISKEKKLYYHDADEPDKIIRALGVDKKDNLLALEGTQDQSGSAKLIAITTDGKAQKKVLVQDIFTVNPPALSSRQDKIALTSFSNAEADFGFSLFIQNLDGSNKRKISQTKTNLLSPSFSPDANQLAYIINLGEQGSKIEVYNLIESSGQTVWETPKIVTNVSWLNDNLVASMSPAGTATANQSELYEIKFSAGQNSSAGAPDTTIKQLTDNQINEDNLFSFNQGQGLAYISQKLASGISGQNTPGEIKVYGQEIDFGEIKASYVFGYITKTKN